jgi:hypothetical protein
VSARACCWSALAAGGGGVQLLWLNAWPCLLGSLWLLLPLPAALRRYAERAQEAARRQVEQERLEAAAAAEQEAQRQRQEARYKRRMLREVVQWVKAAARAPIDAQNRPTVMQRAQRAVKLVGSLNAG